MSRALFKFIYSCSFDRSGHFDFQDDYLREFPAFTSTEDLEVYAFELANTSEAWIRGVGDARARFYFLNFFNMRQILLLVRYLDRMVLSNLQDAPALEMLRLLLRLIIEMDETELVNFAGLWEGLGFEDPLQRLNLVGIRLQIFHSIID